MSESTFNQLPYTVRKNTGFGGWQTLLGVVFAVIYASQDFINRPGPLNEKAPTLILPAMILAVSAFLFVVLRNPTQLTIDQSGVGYVSRRLRYLIAWADITGVTTLNKASRIEVKGAAAGEGVLLPGTLGGDSKRLSALLQEGLARWGAGGAVSVTSHSEVSGDVGNVAAIKLMRQMLLGFTALGGAIIVGLGVFAVSHALRDQYLHDHGVRADAEVVRIYNSSCDRHGCAKRVYYAYRSTDGRTFHGDQYLTTDRHLDDPDYNYVKSHPTIPVAFDPAKPSVSELNIQDSVFTDKNYIDGALWRWGIVSIIIAGIFSLICVPLALGLRGASRATA